MAANPEIVLRFRDGKTQRATLVATDADREIFSIKAEDGKSVDVPFSVLKAVFFPQREPDDSMEPAVGSQLSVEFADGEVIRGIAHYNPERNGFYLFPNDRSKNDRIFVVNSAIMSIEVEKL